MKHAVFAIAIALVAALTVLAGVLQGRMSNRWGPSPDMLSAANKLKQIPQQFGDWRLKSTADLDKNSLEQLDPAGYLVRAYENQATGEVVSVTVLLGRPGPISVHTPEICMGSQNYQCRGERQKVTIGGAAGENDEFWALDYKTNDLRGDLLRVYYGWSFGDRWSAAKDARFWSAGKPYLYKIQLSGLLPPGAGPQSDDPCHKFLKDFVPAAKECLIAPLAK
jgi:hypothetical protein